MDRGRLKWTVHGGDEVYAFFYFIFLDSIDLKRLIRDDKFTFENRQFKKVLAKIGL